MKKVTTTTPVRKATKKVVKSKHTDIQKAYHGLLRKLGYTVEFCCGFEEAQK